RFCVEADAAGVFVLMHDTISDTAASVHLGTRVRKMHTSRRDAFQSINSPPIARVDFEGNIEMLAKVGPRGQGALELKDTMDRSVLLLQFYPGMDHEGMGRLIQQYKGVVIAGSGLGHVSSQMIPELAKAVEQGIVVVMTSQCLFGRVNLNVYATGRDIINAGVIPAEDMLPETTLVKLMWALGQSADRAEVVRLMAADICGEMSARREIDG
ncbi:MAG TPA: asparaginase domain-containing protein, partial [Methanomassiliicoccales archaeon]|nr:asparaginase domain-containing protein [Methanomassiliicoccales archaeon]